jgi:adenosine deaminase
LIDLKEKISTLKKADVHSHLHLAGSQKRLSERYPNAQINFPDQYNGLSGMIEFIYGSLNTIMTTKEDVINFMDIAIQSAIDDNVTLLEASVDIGLAKYFNKSIEQLIDEVIKLQEKYKSELNFRPDIGVNKDLDIDKVYSYGLKCIESGIFHGIDLYGQEAGKDLNPFTRLYNIANDNGLKTKVHIGEFSNHQSIEETIKILNPDEIQHGIRAVDSENTMELILKNDIRLNICPQSNIALGAVKQLKDHPARILHDYGIKITINTDDLILFNASVSDEYINLIKAKVFTFDEIKLIQLNGLNL